MDNISLIYSDAHTGGLEAFMRELGLISQLGADWLMWSKKVNMLEFVTDDISAIRRRSDAFDDLSRIDGLAALTGEAAAMLDNISELRRIKGGNDTNETMLYSIKEVEVYIDFITRISEGFTALPEKPRSAAFTALSDMIRETENSPEFTALREGVSRLSMSVKNIRSLTVGINLDGNLSPYESGIVAVNSEYFRSGDIIDRFMRMELKQDEMMTLAPLTAAGRQLSPRDQTAVDAAVNSALKKIVGAGLRGWQSMLKKYFMMNTDVYVRLLPELNFLCAGARIIHEMQDCGLEICIPEARPAEEKCFDVRGLCNPATAQKLKSENSEAKIIPNDLAFDRDGMLYILTGPNRGGKSVILCAVGIAQLMFQLGLPVAARSARISPADGIYTHFTTESGSTTGKGRLGEECARLERLFGLISENSLVLLDETLSSTDSFEASAIACEVLAGLSAYGCRGIFATHLHELERHVAEINALPTSRSRLDTLVAGMESGERSYIIERRQPDGKSYARDIADRYGLSLEKILAVRMRDIRDQ